MRLGQLSRKLDVLPSKIISFIRSEFNEEIENHPNTKIEDSFLEKIFEEFRKEEPKVEKVETPPAKEISDENKATKEQQSIEELEKKDTTTAKVNDDKTSTESTEEDRLDNKIDTKNQENSEDTVNTESVKPVVIERMGEISPKEREEAELIKAPKVELKAPKVVGKIELPTKKKVIEEVASDKSEKESKPDVDTLEKELKKSLEKPATIRKKKSTYKRPNSPMKKKKSVDEILAEKRKAEEKRRREEERKKREREEQERIKRKKHYEEIAKKTKAPKKKKKKKEKRKAEQRQVKNTPEKKSGSWIVRLIEWFKTS